MSRVTSWAVLAGVVALAGTPASAGDCSYLHPDIGLLGPQGARVVLLPPQARMVDTEGRPAGDAPGLAERLAPELHCRLETMGHDVDGHSLAADALSEDPQLRLLVDRAWDDFDDRLAGLCLPDVPLDPERYTFWDAAPPLALPLRADALILSRASAVVKTRGARAFARTLEAVAPDVDWPGPDMDATWVEVALVDGSSGRLLAYAGAAELGDVSRHPAGIVSMAVQRALQDLPAAGVAAPEIASRVLRPSPAFTRWQRGTSSEIGQRARLPRDRSLAPPPSDLPDRPAASAESGTTIVLRRQSGPPSLLVTNATSQSLRVRAGTRGGVELSPGDAALLDVDPRAPVLVVEDLGGREQARADCAEALALGIEARILARGPADDSSGRE